MPTWKAWKDKNNNVFYFDNDHDYQADINAAVAKGDTAAAAKAWDLRRAKGEANGLNLKMGNTNPYGATGGTYNGTSYSNSIDYGLSADAKFAAGDIEGAREDERKGNAKILGNNMNLELRNKYGSYSDTGKDTPSTDYNSKYSEDLDKILGSITDAITNAPPISMPGYSAPTYNPQYDAQIDELLNKLLNREPFEYNEELDPLYQQYKDMYTKQGQLAMEDTMGQAAALTGGYSSTYSQAVGQQMYNAYLNKVQEMLPEFYDRAYGQYQDEGTNLKNLYSMYIDRDQVDFQRYQQEVANAQAAYQAAAAAASMAYQQQQDNISNLGNLYGLVSGADATDYERFLNNWNMNNMLDQQEYNKLIDKWNQDMQLNESNYNRRQDTQKLAQSQIDAIIAAGGTPSQALISASGYDPSYINSLMSYYQQQAAAQTAARSSGSSGGGGSSRTYPSDKDYKVNKDGSVSVKKVRQLSYQPDEGVFKWNGNQYTSVDSLVDAWSNSSQLTNDDLQVLERKLRSQVSKVQHGGKSGSF
jgi:hypothetical protein